MKVLKSTAAVFLALTASVAAGYPGDDGEGILEVHECPLLPKETKAQKDARMAWWAEARFGMFIHFGLYASLGRHEWVQRYELIRAEDYEARYMKRFNPDRYDAKEWVRRAKAAGMKYIVLTTKHHEGFCMWDSRTTDYKITNTAFRRDLVREYVDACREAGIRVGFYYSIIDWHHPEFRIDTIHPLSHILSKEEVAKLNAGRDMAKYRACMMRQVTELLTEYGKIDILFFDFTHPGYHQMGRNGREDYHSEELLALVRRLQPQIIVNDRLGLKDVVGGWDMKTPEQVIVPKCPTFNGEEIYWETCQTFSGSWGYYRDELTWKSPRQLLYILIDSVSKKGNLLLNVGPTARGRFDRRACDRLDGIGRWMDDNCRSIY
jgi:alpha-L-fucosidase